MSSQGGFETRPYGVPSTGNEVCLVGSPHARHKAARIHHASRQRGGLAAPSERAAGRPRAAHRRAHGERRKRSCVATLAFTQALAGLGWTGGRNLRIDFRWSASDSNRIPALAQELVGLQPDVVLTGGITTTVALQRETRTIPIVFANVGDPVASGIVARLDRPSGNFTGFATFEAPLGGKWLELLSEIAPGLKRAAIIFNPDTAPASTYMPS